MPPKSQACCSHDHDCETTECGVAYSLYKHIDIPQVRCLNAQDSTAARNIFKPWHDRLTPTAVPLRSQEDDPELLIHIPFDGAIKLKGISIIGGPDGRYPAQMKVYTNRDGLDFDTASNLPAVQEWDLVEDMRGVMEYQTQVAKFNGVWAVDILLKGVCGGDDADFMEVHYLGFKGEYSERRRQAVEAVYEARAMPGDHKVDGLHQGAQWGPST